MKTKSPILERNGRWILQKTFDGKQKQIALDTTDEKVATTRANRFLACYEVNGFQTALDELRKKPVVKRGDDLTFAQMEQIYREYLAQADNPPRPATVKHSLSVLKRIMNGKPISKLNMVEVRGRLLIDQDNPSNRRSYASNCRHASAIFKPACLKFYKTKGITLLSPFAEMEFQNPTVQPYIPMSQETLEKIYNGSLTELPPTEALIVNSCLTGHSGLKRLIFPYSTGFPADFTFHGGGYIPDPGAPQVPFVAASKSFNRVAWSAVGSVI